MPHADAANIDSYRPKQEVYDDILTNLDSLLTGQTNWISNLSNTSSILFWTLKEINKINWAGFYIYNKSTKILELGPFHGLPACQIIKAELNKGICADTFCKSQPILVPNVDEYPGKHIACDSTTKSELVLPVFSSSSTCIGVMDFDSLVLNGFDEVDKVNMEKITHLLTEKCDFSSLL
ncbi:GAF domain-like protein [Wallemia mellicola]|uniref:GAF domain-like protein n=1 Tax=Wallemia mellicola TaxID=1708541 RepID=A0AB38MZL2_9BASI|nr:GAF domain-like protein [Wallemia mellicola]